MTLRIAIPIFEDCDLIDVTVPYDVLSRIEPFWKGDGADDVDLKVVAQSMAPVCTAQKLDITPQATFDDYGAATVLLVPGAQDVANALKPEFQKFLRAQGAQAKWVTSVCTGAIALAHAGLLDGYQATTHWAALDDLKKYEKVNVVNGHPRWVHDRNRITGGGVSSSLDAAIYLISQLVNDHVAKCAQLVVQYHPQPPFNCGDPCVADYDTYSAVAGG